MKWKAEEKSYAIAEQNNLISSYYFVRPRFLNNTDHNSSSYLYWS
jgi:hypothetical protein